MGFAGKRGKATTDPTNLSTFFLKKNVSESQMQRSRKAMGTAKAARVFDEACHSCRHLGPTHLDFLLTIRGNA